MTLEERIRSYVGRVRPRSMSFVAVDGGWQVSVHAGGNSYRVEIGGDLADALHNALVERPEERRPSLRKPPLRDNSDIL